MNSDFLRQVFKEDKKLLKKAEIKPIGKMYGFKNLSTHRILELFPDRALAEKYLPDISAISKLDRGFVLTAS